MVAAADTRGNIIIKQVIPAHMESVISKLVEIGCNVEEKRYYSYHRG